MSAISATTAGMRDMADLKERFNAKWILNKNTGCHEWTACKTPNGYGAFQMPERKKTGAHRVSWMLNRGEIPDGMYACHKCDNPSCVNPEHLFLGSAKDNALDRNAKGRHADVSGDKNAMHKITDKQRMEITDLYKNSKLKIKEIAEKLNICAASVLIIAKKNGVVRGKAGERNGRSKLNIEQVIEIKRLLSLGKPRKEIAKTFQVSACPINLIATGNGWKNV